MIYIIGAGLFGSIASQLLEKRGHQTCLIDDNRPGAGSQVAACLIRPSWISGLPKQMREKGMEVLHELFEVHTIPFSIRPSGKKVNVWWVDPKKILLKPSIKGTVTQISKNKICGNKNGTKFDIPLDEETNSKILVAAGIWSNKLLDFDIPEIRPLAGIVSRYVGQGDPFIDVWAPYKQIVGFNIEPKTYWCSDGSAILKKNWTSERVMQSLARCHKAIPKEIQSEQKFQVGYRPYMKGYRGFFDKLSDTIYCSSNGAKNGTLVAAYQAWQFLQEIENAN